MGSSTISDHPGIAFAIPQYSRPCQLIIIRIVLSNGTASPHLYCLRYPTDVDPTQKELAHRRIRTQLVLPHWNYTIQPNL